MSEFDFIQKADTLNNKSDISFYIPAHELTHHWWGNLLTPGDALGASVLTESITEYVTLQIYKDYYGEEIARKFLSFQQRRYWQGRNSKQGKEPALYRAKSTENYLNYGKGTLVFHALSQKLGEDSLNYILKTFLEAYPSEKEIYPTTLDFIQHLKNGTSSDMHYFIEDAFKKVITYDISIDDVNSQEESNGNFNNTIQFSVNKFSRKDTLSELNPLENIVISCYDEKEDLIKKESFFIKTGMNTYSIKTPTKPYKITIDENYLFIESKKKDNEWILK